jgi:hypothetical protein
MRGYLLQIKPDMGSVTGIYFWMPVVSIDHLSLLRHNYTRLYNNCTKACLQGESAMKITLLLSMLIICFSVIANADIYQWVDNKGVVNFTDNIDSIPKKYHQKVKIISSGESGQDDTASEPAQSTVQDAPMVQSGESPQQQKLFGGHDEMWWRSQFSTLRGELAQLQSTLPSKRTEAEQLRRKLVIYTYARNRVAYQEKLDEIQRDEEKITSLNEQLTALDTQATAAGVPFEWRK